ncbi:MAG: ferrous iron transport protein B [Thermoguttaceae bacterium]
MDRCCEKTARPALSTVCKPLVVALAGNPNSGKTTLFNALTGSRQHVGNYPGVTVETKQGRFEHHGREICVVDLPGTYSLTAYSAEELVARDFLIDGRPDVVVDVIDASNLERNLYLAVQFLELGVPLILALNMSDLAESRGFTIDVPMLSALLGVPIVATVGHKSRGIESLKDAVTAMVDEGVVRRTVSIRFDAAIEAELDRVASVLEEEWGEEWGADGRRAHFHCRDCGGCSSSARASTRPCSRWMAVKLLEHDEEVTRKVSCELSDPKTFLAVVAEASHAVETHFGDAPEMAIADGRYRFIARVCREAVNRTEAEHRRFLSDRIDAVVTHRLLGIPIFLGMMYLVFWLTFTLGRPPMEWLESLFGWLGQTVAGFWPVGSDAAMKSLVVDGVLGGVGGVLVFLPNILLLFLAISLLEDSGYMARAAFLTDRLMHKIGLHGKSFIPMLIGFGCTVPAILGARVLENRRDRLTTMLVLPLMSCGARLPIYTLLIPAFFPNVWQGPVLWLIYLIGVVLAIILAKILRTSVFRGEPAPFVMELPPYRMPTLKSTLLHVGERGWQFLRKAGTLILAVSALLWVLTAYPRPPAEMLKGLDAHQSHSVRLSYSAAGRLGHALEPVMRPIGFDWKTNTALIGAVAAKEVFVAQLGIVHSLGEGDSHSLREALRHEYTPLQAFCIMLFCLISLPCSATLITVARESGSWRWAAAQLVGLTALAYVLTFLVYHVGLTIWP